MAMTLVYVFISALSVSILSLVIGLFISSKDEKDCITFKIPVAFKHNSIKYFKYILFSSSYIGLITWLAFYIASDEKDIFSVFISWFVFLEILSIILNVVILAARDESNGNDKATVFKYNKFDDVQHLLYFNLMILKILTIITFIFIPNALVVVIFLLVLKFTFSSINKKDNINKKEKEKEEIYNDDEEDLDEDLTQEDVSFFLENYKDAEIINCLKEDITHGKDISEYIDIIKKFVKNNKVQKSTGPTPD